MSDHGIITGMGIVQNSPNFGPLSLRNGNFSVILDYNYSSIIQDFHC